MEGRHSMVERSRIPLILWLADVAVVLGLPSPRAAGEFLANNGVPHARVAGRVFVLSETLVAFIKEHEERRETPAEARERADAVVRQIAPTARQCRRGRKPPEVEKE